MSTSQSLRSARNITSTRIFAAPPEQVWQAWTDPEKLIRWWGPEGFTTTIHSMDFCIGGEWIFTMHGPDGTDYPNHKTFSEIHYQKRIVMVHKGPPAHSMTIDFEAHGTGTRLTMLHLFDTLADYDFAVAGHGAVDGAIQHLSRLEFYLNAIDP